LKVQWLTILMNFYSELLWMFRKASTMIKDWDLNIYFVEEDDNVYSETLRINPVLWTMDNGLSDVTYSNWFIDTTFAETRYLRSQYPENDYGMDWTESLTIFLEYAPPRLKQVLLSLPQAEMVEPKDVLELVG
jgi:hypothetical protein